MADAGTWALAVATALAAAGALTLRADRHRAAAMAAALLLAAALIAADSWDDERFRDLREHTAVLAVAALAGLAVVAALAALFLRRPEALPLLAIAALPFRVPIESGGDSANLLLPLYAVLGGGVVAALAIGSRPPSPVPRVAARALRWLPYALAVLIVLYAVQGVHSDDFSQAAANVGFFLVPFAVLLALLARVEWDRRLLRWALAIVVAEALLFTLVAFGEYAMRELLWNPAIIEANEIHTHFRVNSLFWDPNIFGRFLAVTIVAVAAVMLWQRSPRTVAGAGAVAFVLLAGVATTLSQSSLVAILAGLAVLAGLRWSARWALGVCGTLLVAGLVALAAGGAFDSDESSRKSIQVNTSGRWELIEGGLEMAGDAPVAGLGSGAFEEEFQERYRAGEEAAGTVSHTEPVTVLAEQGALGFVVYVAVVALAFAALLHGIKGFAPGIRGGGKALGPGEGLARGIARAALVAALAAMFVHSLSYAAFFTDPITWALLAIGLALGKGSDPLPNS